MTLTNEYQYIGRSNAVNSNDGTYKYYVLIYAKTTGSMSTGKHTVSIKTRMACAGASSFYNWPTKGYIKANGKAVKEWEMQPYPSKAWNTTSITEGGVKYPQWVDMMEVSTTVDTGYGATNDIVIESSWTMQGGDGSAYLPKPNSPGTASITVTLPMIAGASTITSVAAITIGKACSVKWTPLSSAFGFKLKFSIGNWSYTTGAITPKTTSAYTYTGYKIPMDVAEQITKAPSGDMKVELVSYLESSCTTKIGSDTETVKATVPDNSSTKPSVSMSLSLVSSLGSAFAGLYIQNLTKVSASISASGKYDATISKTQAYIGGTKFSGTSGLISQTGEVTVTGEAVDSRGYVGKTEKVITVLPYSKPALVPAAGETGIVCVRCDSSGKYSNSGTYLRIKAKRDYSPILAGGVQKNFCSIRYRVNGGSWTEILDEKASSDEIDTGAISGKVTSVTSEYTIEIGVVDDVGNSSTTKVIIPTESVTFSLRNGGSGAAFGEYSTEENVLAVAPEWELHAKGTSMFAMEWLGFDSASGDITDTFQADLEAVFAGMERYCYKKVQFVDPQLNNQKHMGTLWKYTNNYGFLTAENYSGVKAIKTYYGGEWLPWEWENPPMSPDVEYRTTERHNGKVVYTKLVDFGALPNATEKIVTCMPKNASMIEAVGYASGTTYNLLIPGYKSIESMGSNRSSGTLWISTTNDMSAYNAWITIKYTK